MSRLASRTPKGCLLRSFAAPSPRCAAPSGTRLLSTEKKKPEQDGPSFKGQMLESIADRLSRERKERELAAMSRPENAASRNWGITGMIILTALGCYYMGTKYPRDVDPNSTLPLSATRPPKHETGKASWKPPGPTSPTWWARKTSAPRTAIWNTMLHPIGPRIRPIPPNGPFALYIPLPQRR